MPALNPQSVLESSKCFACLGASLADLFILSLWDLISQSIGGVTPVDPYDGNLVYTRQGLGDTTIVNPVGSFILNFGANPVTAIHCHNCPNITSLAAQNSAVLTVIDLENVPSLDVLNFNNSDGLISANFSLLNNPVMNTISLTGCAILTAIDITGVTSCATLDIHTNPLLATFTNPSLATAGNINFGLTGFVSISFPALTSTTGFISWNNCNSLLSVSFPVLFLCNGSFGAQACPLLNSISAPLLTSASTIFAFSMNALTSLSLPALNFSNLQINDNPSLVSFSAVNMNSGDADFSNCTSLSVLTMPLWEIATNVYLDNCAIVNLNLPAFDVNVCEYFSANGCAVMNTLSFPGSILQEGSTWLFFDCGLNQSAVDYILQSAVNGGMTFGYIELSGGTNSVPSAGGLVNKGILIGAGVTVNTN